VTPKSRDQTGLEAEILSLALAQDYYRFWPLPRPRNST